MRYRIPHEGACVDDTPRAIADRGPGPCPEPEVALAPETGPGRAPRLNGTAYGPLSETSAGDVEGRQGGRVQVTVLFADLRNSLRLIADREPEEALELLDTVTTVLVGSVRRCGGTVCHILGDGLMAVFGAPEAQDDHALRACRAALDMLAGMKGLASRLRGQFGRGLAIRIGLNSGPAMLATPNSDPLGHPTPIGIAVHLASRVEQKARPGTALMTAATWRATRGLVEVRGVGTIRVKGLRAPVEVVELLGLTEPAPPSERPRPP